MKGFLLAAGWVLLFAACGWSGGGAGTHPQAPTPTPTVLLDDQGSGSRSTGTFAVPAEWSLAWSFDCPAQCNFSIQVHTQDGSLSKQNKGLGQAGDEGQGVLRYHTGGTFFLTVDACCTENTWMLKVIG